MTLVIPRLVSASRLYKENIKIMSLLETKVKSENEAKIFEKSLKNWNLLSNSQPDRAARIGICWDPNFCNIVSIRMAAQFVFCRVTILEGDTSFFAIFVYAENEHMLKLPCFAEICSLVKNRVSSPLICLGDFNAVRFSYEKLGGNASWNSSKDLFNNMILDVDLEDLSYTGCQFTWSNKRNEGAYITSKIDRALVNEKWLTSYPNSSALFLPSVDEVWRKYIKGSPMFRVCQKLRTLKPILKNLNKKEFSDISTRVSHAKDQLVSAQIKLDKDPLNGDLQTHERVAYAKNSKFFFRTIKGNINKGRIQSVVLNDGVRMPKSEEICATFVNSFTDLFGKLEVSDKEIINAFNSLKPNKAPGPDGYSAGFFKKSWEVVGKDVVVTIKSFFWSGELLQALNSTTIALIPKTPNAEKVGDFWPISCCNTLYICISKIIVDRIKVVSPDLIDPVWDFVLDVLRAMGFPPNIICWVKAWARGLRQGDPMSPYLFVMVMEILSKILAEKSTHPDFKFHWRYDKTKIVNLCFADDLMIFCKGDVFTVLVIKEGLDEFQSLSGLSPSPHKSHIFFSGCEKKLRDELLNVVKFNEGLLPVRCLGVPLISTKLKSSDCDKLFERITNRIKS
ncbi:uncharacterized protein LOC114271244 [Camellia sinensis]|uniref:uncharacterized protein LOC114271244 n=1 Tax=Camellia sinensis TaxID=4442 RepID=UPI001035D11C|nr:uncharacterized protein LOC114271244 [Camellia sinensis]